MKLLLAHDEGNVIRIVAFELRLKFRGSVRAVWYWHRMEGSSVKGAEDSGALW